MIARMLIFLRMFALLLFFPVILGCGGQDGGEAVDATNGSSPVTEVLTADGIGLTGATLNGIVIPNGLSTEVWFEWGTNSTLSTFDNTASQPVGSGLNAVTVSDTVIGLADNTIHYFRVCAANSKGTKKSSIQNFTTSSAGSSPVATTAVATSVSVSTATLNGNVTPNGLATDAWFEWGTDSTLSPFSSTSSQAVGSGTISQLLSAGLTGLSAGIPHYYRVAARNGLGTTKGGISSFTPAAVPAVTTLAATPVGLSTATLNGSVTPNGLPTDAWFEWGTDSGLSSFDSTAPQAVGSGTTGQTVNAPLTGLAAGITYYYRVAASNGTGTNRGSILSIVPGAAPAVTTLPASPVGGTSATLNGSVTPNGLATDAWFEWGTDPALSSFDSTSFQAVGSGTGSQAFNAGLTGLSAGTTYYYRIAANNGTGTSRGIIRSFLTGSIPVTTTGAATSVGVGSATLNGHVTPNGLATNAWFEWGTNSTLSTYSSTTSQSIGSGTVSQSVSAYLSGLSGGTTYYYRIAATNASGTQKGAIVSFSTTSGTSAPIPISLPATLVTTGAICNGKVNPNGLASTAWFEWGTDPALSSYNTSTSQSIGSGTTNKYMNEPLIGRPAGTTYYYRVVGNNSAGTSRGAIQSFTAATGTWGFFDDFSTDTTGVYDVYPTLGTESFTYDSTGKKVLVTTGVGGNLGFTHSLPGGYTGAFSIDFSPTREYGSGGNIKIRINDTPLTYYEISTADAWIVKSRKGVVVETVPFPHSYSQGGNYTIKITFDPMVTTVEAFGGRASLTVNQAANPTNYFEITSTQQDASFDNIKVATPP